MKCSALFSAGRLDLSGQAPGADSRMVAPPEECLRHSFERLRRSLPASANCSGAAAEQWNLRKLLGRQPAGNRRELLKIKDDAAAAEAALATWGM